MEPGSSFCGIDVDLHVVDEDAFLRVEADPFQGQVVDRGILAAADESRVDHGPKSSPIGIIEAFDFSTLTLLVRSEVRMPSRRTSGSGRSCPGSGSRALKEQQPEVPISPPVAEQRLEAIRQLDLEFLSVIRHTELEEGLRPPSRSAPAAPRRRSWAGSRPGPAPKRMFDQRGVVSTRRNPR